MKYIKTYFFFTLIFLGINNSNAQEIVEPSPIKWYTFEQADSLNKIQKRPLFIDVYTEWCGWCKRMMKSTFAHKGIAGYINQNFYAVRFDAETFDTIKYQGKTYTNPGVGKKPKHDLAKYLLDGRYSFPTIVYISRNNLKVPIPGYQEIAEIESFLIYFTEDLYESVRLDDFDRYFKCTYKKNFKEEDLQVIPDSLRPDTTGVVKWYSLEEAEILSKKTQKPIYINFYTNWCQSCKLTDNMTFKIDVIADLLNEYFIPVRFDAASQDSVKFFGNTFKGTGQYQPHQFARAYFKSGFKMPADLYINPAGKVLTEFHGFVPPSSFEVMLNFFNEKAYLKKSYQEYLKTFSNKIKY